MKIHPSVIDNVEKLQYETRIIKKDVSLANIFIFNLFLNYVSSKGIGAKPGEFEVYHRVLDGLKSGDKIVSLKDLEIVLKNAGEYYDSSAFSSVPLIYTDQSILKVLSNSNLNKLSEFLLSINKKESLDDYNFYIDNLLYILNKILSFHDFFYLSLNSKATKLVASILDVQETEIFMDIVSGLGLSTLQIVGHSKTQVKLSEISKDIAKLSEMLMIVSEKENYNISVEDSLFAKEVEIASVDKIFFDPPIKAYNEYKEEIAFNNIPLQESSVSAVLRAASALKDNGKAVVTVPPFFLHSNNPKTVKARSYLLENRLLEAVITLPPCWSGTSIATNLVILSKKDNKEVTFINLKNDQRFVYRNELLDDAISFILDALSGKVEESKFYSRKLIQDVNKESIIPIAYLESEKEKYTKEFVSKRLNELYDRLNTILEENR